MKIMLVVALTASVALAQEGPGGGAPSVMRRSPILNAVDVNQDGVLSAAEIANAPAQLRKLDKDGDGKLNAAEAGIQAPARGGGGRGGEGRGGDGKGEGAKGPKVPDAEPPSAEELTTTLLMFDANGDGKLQKSEVPERLQGLFERGDTNHDGVLTREEITRLAEANRQAALGGGAGGRGGGKGGPPDMAFLALDTDHNGEISAEEISHAAASLKTLDKNGDGQITEDEVTPNAPGRGGEGPGPGGPGR